MSYLFFWLLPVIALVVAWVIGNYGLLMLTVVWLAVLIVSAIIVKRKQKSIQRG